MNFKRCIWAIVMSFALSVSALAGTFGIPVAVGGHASDLALDEGRGVLYVANFTRNQIHVMSLAGNTLQESIPVAPQPSAIALSPDARFLVIVHFGNFADPIPSNNSITVLDLNSREQKSYKLATPPIGVAFGTDSQALIVTTTDFIRFDPVTGTATKLDTVANVAAKTLPQPPATFPNTIKSASLGVSGDGLNIYGFGEGVTFKYDVLAKKVIPGGYRSAVPIGPRVVSVNRDGTAYMAGWLMVDSNGVFKNLFTSRAGLLDIGSTAFDDRRGVLYAQIPESGATVASAPVLKIVSTDNLALKEQLQLTENLTGKSVMSSDGNTLYAVSDSGVMVMQVGSLDRLPRIVADKQDLVFRGNFCDRGTITQTVVISDAGGRNIPFTLTPTTPGVNVSPAGGVTPATVRVTIDANVLQSVKGTTSGLLRVRSSAAVNVPKDIRLLVNSRDADQRGWFYNVPGNLAHIVADPIRDRFYIVRSDTNELLVFDSNTYAQIASLPTGNNPSFAAILPDQRWLLVANQDSEYFNVYDLETLQSAPIINYSNGGAQVLAVGVTSRNVIANIIDSEGKGHIYRVDFDKRIVVRYPSLGVYSNDNILPGTTMASAPDFSSVLIAQPDGNLMVYDAQSDTFSVSRKDTATNSGPLAVAPGGNYYVVGNRLLNASLIPISTLESATGQASAFAFLGNTGLRLTAPNASSPGVIQKVDLQTGVVLKPTRLVEAPQISTVANPFPNTLALLPNGRSMIVLSTSGFTVIPMNYDDAAAPPQIERVVNAADLTKPIAPKGLITLFGSNLSPMSLGSGEISPSAALQQSCLQVNGASVPVLYVSNNQINAQLPNLDGSTSMKLVTPGGTSDTFRLTIQPTAPSVFRISSAPAVFKANSNEMVSTANPVRTGDYLTIYATGLGRTTPDVEPGVPAPLDELAPANVAPSVTLNGTALDVMFAGLVPGQVGVYQINVRVTDSVPPSDNGVLEIQQGTGATALPVRVVQ